MSMVAHQNREEEHSQEREILQISDGLSDLTKWDDPFYIVMQSSLGAHVKFLITAFFWQVS